MISINPFDQRPKIKIYRDDEGVAKGDGSICYVARESVDLALNVLSGGYIRPNYLITVTEADFSSVKAKTEEATTSSGSGDVKEIHKRSRPIITAAQRKVAHTAMRQALSWNEDDDTGFNKSKALKIVVLEGLFEPKQFLADAGFEEELQNDLASECEKCGEIDKITLFSKHPKGIVIVKFKTAFAAQECVRLMDGRFFGGKVLKSYYWDGTTNYSLAGMPDQSAEQEVEKQRLDEFGNWLEQEQEDLPEEFQLKVEQ